MAANMYRVGDYVFFETSSTTPYLIRRIEELNKTPNGNVEAKVMCFYRRRDISSNLILLADKHQSDVDEEREETRRHEREERMVLAMASGEDPGEGVPALEGVAKESVLEELGSTMEDLGDKQKHQLKHRELFLSRQVETLPATHIRGKCAVTLLNETESLMSYLNKDDAFFYSLVYDPQQKTLLADKGEIRVGNRFQAEVINSLEEELAEVRRLEDLEQLVWCPDNNLSDRHIDQFMVVARSVGTFARALDCTSTVRQPSLHMSAAAASRDVTLFHAMDTLHRHAYETSRAITSLVPPGGPVLCRDEMEEWSASEANLFEEALDKYGKDFNDIRQDFLPWKSLKSIVEYYYMWKTTDRYVQQKRIKAAEAETKLKQVYIPNYNKPNPAQLPTNKMNGVDVPSAGRPCESCYSTQSSQWFSWGPVQMSCRLCQACWNYWKKYGGLKMPTRLDTAAAASSGFYDQNGDSKRLAHLAAMRMHRCTIGGCGKEFKLKAQLARHLATAHGLAIRAGSPRPVMKTRAAFCLITTPLTRLSRQVCGDILSICRAARQPFTPINIAGIKQECQDRMPSGHTGKLIPLVPKHRPPVNFVLAKLGINVGGELPALLRRDIKGFKEATVLAWPKPRPEDARPLPSPEDLAPPAAEVLLAESPLDAVSGQPSIMRFEQTNGLDGGGMSKLMKPSLGVIRQAGNAKQAGARDPVMAQLNGRILKLPQHRSRKHLGLNWIDAPDDVYFISTDATRKLRKQMNQLEFRRAARKPWRKLRVEVPEWPSIKQPPPSMPMLGPPILID